MASHEEKYLTKLLFGFGSIIGGVMAILYACFERIKDDDWYFWGVVASVLLCLGIFLLMQAFVHKVKSDFSRRQKMRQQQKGGDMEREGY
jgi:uncharacterized membrane protein HdeD (DUF308 family)